METNRLEAFADGVMAVALTIMVLQLHVPHGAHWSALFSLWPVALSYILSFIYIGIYWNNHHHLMRATERIRGLTLWANLHWLFWVTLIPFATAWMNEQKFSTAPVALYGLILLMTALAFFLLQYEVTHFNGPESTLSRAVAHDAKAPWSVALHVLALAVVAWLPWLSCVLYAVVAAVWFIPDRRIEQAVTR